MKAHITTMILIATAAIGCDMTGPQKTTSTDATSVQKVAVTGEVVYRDRDGGFYGILTNNGGQYEPANLAAKYKTDGLHVVISGQLDTAKLGPHHWGNEMEIASISTTK